MMAEKRRATLVEMDPRKYDDPSLSPLREDKMSKSEFDSRSREWLGQATTDGDFKNHSGVNRVLGATSGSEDGNVRAILTIMVAGGAIGFLFCLLFVYANNQSNVVLSDMLKHIADGIIPVFATIIAFYFGVRAAQTS